MAKQYQTVSNDLKCTEHLSWFYACKRWKKTKCLWKLFFRNGRKKKFLIKTFKMAYLRLSTFLEIVKKMFKKSVNCNGIAEYVKIVLEKKKCKKVFEILCCCSWIILSDWLFDFHGINIGILFCFCFFF